MELMKKPLACEKFSHSFADEMMSLDLAMDFFKQQDRDALTTDMKSAESKQESIEDFKLELASKRQVMSQKKKKKRTL